MEEMNIGNDKKYSISQYDMKKFLIDLNYRNPPPGYLLQEPPMKSLASML